MTSLKDIAAELDISYTLVSKVLTGRMGTTGVSQSTREAILKKAKELDYRPNQLAVALKSGKKGAVGLFLHRMGSPGSEMSQKLLFHAAQRLNQSGERLWLRFFEEDAEFLAACDARLTRDIDGLIVAGIAHPTLITKLKKIDQSGLPVVSSFSSTATPPLQASVLVDYEQQGYLPTKHLLERGCRRLAYFNASELRGRGFRRAHQEMNVPVDDRLVLPTEGFSIEDGEACSRRLLKSGAHFDGIVAASDSQGVGAVRVLLNHGSRIPEDIKITGIDDSPLAEACMVPLTSVTSEMEECGRLAMDMLLKRIAGEQVKPVIIKPRLVTRQSTAGQALS